MSRKSPKILRWAKEGTDMIQENAGQLLSLVNQVLTISKLENGSLPFVFGTETS
jgi:hypothetical protein